MKAKKLEYDHQLGDQLGELHKPIYTLLIEQEKLEKIDLFEGQEVRVGTNEYTVEGRRVYRNGKELERGKSTFDKETVTLLVPEEDIFITYIFRHNDLFVARKNQLTLVGHLQTNLFSQIIKYRLLLGNLRSI